MNRLAHRGCRRSRRSMMEPGAAADNACRCGAPGRRLPRPSIGERTPKRRPLVTGIRRGARRASDNRSPGAASQAAPAPSRRSIPSFGGKRKTGRDGHTGRPNPKPRAAERWLNQCNRNSPSIAFNSAGLISRECATSTECKGPSSFSIQKARNLCNSGNFGKRS